MHVGESVMAALIFKRQAGVVNAEKMQDRGV